MISFLTWKHISGFIADIIPLKQLPSKCFGKNVKVVGCPTT